MSDSEKKRCGVCGQPDLTGTHFSANGHEYIPGHWSMRDGQACSCGWTSHTKAWRAHAAHVRRRGEIASEAEPAPPLPKESQACDECDPSFGCFDGSAPCSKRPLPKESQDAEVMDLAAWAKGIAEAQDRVDQSPGECNGCGSTSHGEPCRIHAALARARSDGERQGRERGIEEAAQRAESMKRGYSVDVVTGILGLESDGPWFLKSQVATAIRALLAPPASEEGKK